MLFFTKREATEKVGNVGHIIKKIGNLEEEVVIKVFGSKAISNSQFALKIRGIKNCEIIEEELNKTQYVKHIVEITTAPTFSTAENPLTQEFFAFPASIRRL